jgi:hypothetical protein
VLSPSTTTQGKVGGWLVLYPRTVYAPSSESNHDVNPRHARIAKHRSPTNLSHPSLNTNKTPLPPPGKRAGAVNAQRKKFLNRSPYSPLANARAGAIVPAESNAPKWAEDASKGAYTRRRHHKPISTYFHHFQHTSVRVLLSCLASLSLPCVLLCQFCQFCQFCHFLFSLPTLQPIVSFAPVGDR